MSQNDRFSIVKNGCCIDLVEIVSKSVFTNERNGKKRRCGVENESTLQLMINHIKIVSCTNFGLVPHHFSANNDDEIEWQRLRVMESLQRSYLGDTYAS